MKQFLELFGKYIRPYRHYITGGIIANTLPVLLNLLAFSFIMPILCTPFGTKRTTSVYHTLDSINWLRPSDWSVAVDYTVDNFSYYVSQLIQQYGPSRMLLLLCIYLIVMTLVKVGVIYGGVYMLAPTRTGVVRDLRSEFNTKLLQLPISLTSEECKGDLLARFSGDVAEVEYSITSTLKSLIKNSTLIVIYLIALFAINWEFTLLVLFVLPIAGYTMGAVGKRLKRDSLEGQIQWGRLTSMVEGTLSGLRIIKAFNAERQISYRFISASEHYRRTITQAYARQGLAYPMSKFFGTTVIAIIL